MRNKSSLPFSEAEVRWNGSCKRDVNSVLDIHKVFNLGFEFSEMLTPSKNLPQPLYQEKSVQIFRMEQMERNVFKFSFDP